ncbi:phosphatidylinositol 3-kinase catalytic subunit type 3 [Zeugodacus cucurbitae]|uniref:Phosphatidylinositol 3-kinase catalytic subunit type 3 n=1 Tax=Zeugodacus cucurbitae TaxID=28588 RepID=A0A0A1WEN6_ZEUCU|nr:phosphatidylinositol 3-kinase catalytic subunit type 3 [Zeugodacus cucurbitae]
MNQLPDDHFRYIYSSSLHEQVQIKVGTLEGKKRQPDFEKLLEDPILRFSGLYSEECPAFQIRLQVFNKNRPYCLPVTTSYKAFSKRWSWNEWVTLPLQFSDLPRTAMLVLTILDCAGAGKTTVIGGTAISLFGKNGLFRQGMFDLRVWLGVEGDGSYPSKTPGKGKESSKSQMQRLGKLAKKHRNGQMHKVDWLDRLTFREIEVINEREKRMSDYMYLMIEFPTAVFQEYYNYSIVYFEPEGDKSHKILTKPKLVTVPDSDILQENLVERKHHRLARSERSRISDRDAKPTAVIRNQLHTIVYRYPPTCVLSSEEQDLLWKFRFYLCSHRKALTKFLKCINWETQHEVMQALSLMSKWEPMDVEDALELLSPVFTHPEVRRYAISRLAQAPDEDLLLYLLQLVQALKYENFNDIVDLHKRLFPDHDVVRSLDGTSTILDSSSICSDSLSGASSVIAASSGGPQRGIVASVLQRNVQPEMSASRTTTTTTATPIAITSTKAGATASAADTPPISISTTSSVIAAAVGGAGDGDNIYVNTTSVVSGSSVGLNTLTSESNTTGALKNDAGDLCTFLIQRACKNPTLANYLYWYLSIEVEDHASLRKQDERVHDMYVMVLRIFLKVLETGNFQLRNIWHNLKKQQILVDELVKLVKMVAKEPGNRNKKTEKFQKLLTETDTFKINFTGFDPRPFPLDPEIYITKIVPSKTSLFKSALMPAKLTFVTTIGKHEYVAIFKHGDDLRQDQLILQMITLMDKLLRRENLDLKLTPYKVLATSSKHGLLQYIDSFTVADVLAREGSIHNFFRKHNPCENGPYGIAAETMDTYIKSCAGYCVITYLLGVGDRHLDNLLLTTNGKLFHIDFGYILGRDPKPMPPPMKLSKEMVEAMGGVSSDHHHEFRKQCYTAYLHLRRHANVMLNLFSLMVDASVPDIALEPDKAVKKVEENLQLGLTDEEAVQHLQALLDVSITAVMPALVEQIHKLAQYWRK